jgi:uncharacterized DUF497 family protein
VYVRAYTLLVEYEWDPVKAEANLAKHGVDFADATGRLLVVCYTRRGSKLRIISARKAAPHERQQYEEQL